MLFFVVIFFLSLIVAGWLSALLAVPSIIMAYWLYCDEQEIRRLSMEIAKSKQETKRWIRNPELGKKGLMEKLTANTLQRMILAEL